MRLFSHLATSASKEALVFGGRAYSFGELDDLSRRYAAGLSRLGVERGDRVAVFAETSPDVVVALLGHHRLGAIHVPINPRYRAEEAGHILRDSGAKAVLVGEGEGLHETLREVGPLPGLEIRIDGARFCDFLRAEPFDGATPADSDTALLIYTSGTTGKSKGVELSFGAVAANVGAVTGLWRFVPEDRLVLALPLFHVHGLCLGIHGMLLSGLATLLFERFDAPRVVEAFEKDRATLFMGVPTMYVKLLDHLASHPESATALSRGRLFTSGSAPLPASDFHLFEEKTGHRILERYGMSETLFTLSNPYDGERRPGTVGVPVPGCEVRLVDDDGRDVSSGKLGEIVVKSNGMMTRYRGRPEETAASFRDGWFFTGDVAQRSEDGYVTIVGRKSVDVIKSGGYKISAREIEDVLSRHPLVKEVAVVGRSDRLFGQKVVAAVVLRATEGAPLDPDVLLEELSAFAAKFLADYKRPRAVIVLPELPRNALGKVQKHRLVSA